MANDRISPAFGDLNPVEEPEVGRVLDLRNTSATDIIRESARGVFKKDAFANTGALKGLVLRVEEPSALQQPNTWFSNVFGTEKPIPFKGVRVRIPEIHANLPEPSKIGPDAGESNKVIDLYPIYIAVNQDVNNQPVAPGDIVLVDYGNRENLTHPQYLGPVFQNTIQGGAAQCSAQSTFNDERKGSLGVSQPPGDLAFSEAKNPESQIPVSTISEPNSKSINTPSVKENISNAIEQGHIKRGETNKSGLPPMQSLETAYIRGKPQRQIELVELPFPEMTTKPGVFIAKEQLSNWTELVEAAKKDKIRIRLNSGFRSYDQQKYLFDNHRAGTPGFNLAARPGHSNHQSGIAFDIAGTRGGFSKTWKWLAKNGHLFGFINTGRFFSQPEPWHTEFLGVEHPRVIAEGKLSVRQKQQPFLA